MEQLTFPVVNGNKNNDLELLGIIALSEGELKGLHVVNAMYYCP